MILDNRTSFEEAYGVKDITSEKMNDAICDWYDIYYAENVPEDEDPCQRLPVAVVSKITKAVFAEYEAKTNGNKEYSERVINALKKVYKKAMQQALIGGSCLLKPIIENDKIRFTVITRGNYLPLGRDGDNTLIDVGLAENIERFGKYYTLFERRYLNEYGRLVIDTRLYRSSTRHHLGEQVPLSMLPQTENLVPVLELNIDNIGLVELRCPAENCIDGSDDSVSVYAAATGLIHNINVNESQLNGEFRRGESRIIVSDDMLKKRINGSRGLDDNLFVGMDDDPESVGINIFSPALRETSFLTRKIEYLRNIESLIGLKRGLLSAVESAERTATEITSSAGDYNLTVIDFQDMWEAAVKNAAMLCSQLGIIYKAKGVSAYNEDDIVITWGNGVLYDEAKTWAEYVQMVASGLLKPEIAVGWYFNLPTETPQDIEKIRTNYMPDLAALVAE